ncbi:hypothetical protein SAMN05421766_101937 [Zobellia uliginosa]|uniref:Uncharacterized protein n=1 Tax=Zobellia uliginosa TaxID=143224 RepID=A0ABY1KK03_9FLAO|nr:hypothetical protein SAMN05421766_101937 [Zobellia uliginosa]
MKKVIRVSLINSPIVITPLISILKSCEMQLNQMICFLTLYIFHNNYIKPIQGKILTN